MRRSKRLQHHQTLLVPSALFLALSGCAEIPPIPTGGNAADSSAESAEQSDQLGPVALENTDSHNDPVDDVADTSWIEPGTPTEGQAMLRVLMTDAPLEAESVFVTFCGVYAERAMAAGDEPAQVAERDESAKRELMRGPDPRSVPNETNRDGTDDVSEAEGQDEASDDDDLARDDAASRDAQDRDEERDDRANDEDGDEEHAVEEVDAGEPHEDDAPHQAARGSDSERAGWYPLSEECQTLDLLTLQGGITEALGATRLPPGEYASIRLMLVEASLILDGVEHSLTVPSGAESGLKIVGTFALEEGVASTLTIDFDAAESVHYAPGNGYMMRPVIKLVDETRHMPDEGQTATRDQDEQDGNEEDGNDEPPSEDPEGNKPNDDVTDDGVTDDGVTDDGVTDDGVTDDGVTDDDVTDDDVTDDDVTDDDVTDDDVTDDDGHAEAADDTEAETTN